MKISIITAVYNAERTVGEAIHSVARQTYPNVEHLIIEGKSTDGSLIAINQSAHARISVISEPDKGIYDALNKGIARAKGDVIGFVHSDDFFAADDVLDSIAQAFSNPKVNVVFGNLDYVSQNDTKHIIRHWATGPYTESKLRKGWMPPHPTLYVRKAVYDDIGVFDTRYGISADYDFILRLFSNFHGQAIYVPQVFYKMRVGGVSNRNLKKINQKMKEDYSAIRRNNVGGLSTLIWKNLSKLKQFGPIFKASVAVEKKSR